MSDTDKNKPFTIKSKIAEVKKKKEEDAKPKPPPAPIKEDKRYQKRQPLTKEEHVFLKDFYYKKSGYSGRDVLYQQLRCKRHAKEETHFKKTHVGVLSAEWWKLVQKHKDLYNTKTNRNIRLKDKADPKATYKIYTPNELWQEDRHVLIRLFENKNKDLSQGHKQSTSTKTIEVGDTVRVPADRKQPNILSATVHTVTKTEHPNKFYVSNNKTNKLVKEPYAGNVISKLPFKVGDDV